MRTLKPAPDPWAELPEPPATSPRRPAKRAAAPVPSPRDRDRVPAAIAVADGAIALTWGLITLPFRLVFGLISLAGRLVGVGLGFGLMVLGAALAAGPLAGPGIFLFLIGLLIALRALG